MGSKPDAVLSQVFYRIALAKHSATVKRKRLYWSLFSNVAVDTATLLREESDVFPKFAKFFKAALLQSTYR